MDDRKFLRWIVFVVAAISAMLFLARSFVYGEAWLSVLIGGGYSVFSFMIYQAVLGIVVRKSLTPGLAFAIVSLLLPIKLLALIAFAFHLSRQPGASLAWHLVGLLIFIPVAIGMAQADSRSRREKSG